MQKIEVTLPNGQKVKADASTLQVIVESKISLEEYLNGRATIKHPTKRKARCKFSVAEILAMKALREDNPGKTLEQLREMSGRKWSITAISRASTGKYDQFLR